MNIFRRIYNFFVTPKKTEEIKDTPIIRERVPTKVRKVYPKDKPALMKKYLADPMRKKLTFNQWIKRYKV